MFCFLICYTSVSKWVSEIMSLCDKRIYAFVSAEYYLKSYCSFYLTAIEVFNPSSQQSVQSLTTTSTSESPYMTFEAAVVNYVLHAPEDTPMLLFLSGFIIRPRFIVLHRFIWSIYIYYTSARVQHTKFYMLLSFKYACEFNPRIFCTWCKNPLYCVNRILESLNITYRRRNSIRQIQLLNLERSFYKLSIGEIRCHSWY